MGLIFVTFVSSDAAASSSLATAFRKLVPKRIRQSRGSVPHTGPRCTTRREGPLGQLNDRTSRSRRCRSSSPWYVGEEATRRHRSQQGRQDQLFNCIMGTILWRKRACSSTAGTWASSPPPRPLGMCELSRTLREPYGRGGRPPGDRGRKPLPFRSQTPLRHTDLMEARSC